MALADLKHALNDTNQIEVTTASRGVARLVSQHQRQRRSVLKFTVS